MNCKECISLLEDYRYRRLDATADTHLAIHLRACDGCAGEYALLRREQEIYTQCELQVAPEFWAGVQARISREKDLRAGWLAGLWSGLRLNPALSVAICLLVLSSSVGLLRYVEKPAGQSVTAARPQNIQQPGVALTTKPTRAAQVVDDGQKPLLDRVEKNARSRGTLALRRPNLRPAGMSSAARDFAKKMENPAPGADVVAEHRPLTPAQKTIASDFDADSARHIERAEMLLLSFKNGRLWPDANTLDINYERRLAKDLVGHNILLRRDAELGGNVALARLLDRLEPFLLDIANLRNKSDREEIRFVREGLMREQIIAALQAF